MSRAKKVFIFGAGFSKPAAMPLATDLLPLLCKQLDDADMQYWLDGLRQRLVWLARHDQNSDSFPLNIEEVFHHAFFDIEVHRLKQHLATVGRGDGPATPWNNADSISAWLRHLEEVLQDVILEMDTAANLDPIVRWATAVTEHDSVITFNYDTLVERALSVVKKKWNHGIKETEGIGVFKLHGSIDWIVAPRLQNLGKADLLFNKSNTNQTPQDTGHIEDDYRLWRCRTREQLKEWISGRDIQSGSGGEFTSTVGITGLGAYKQPHQIPGLGLVWTQGMRALYDADLGIVVGFSMSAFDTMAQMQFAEVARARCKEKRPLKVILVDPNVNESTKKRFENVFRKVVFVKKRHEDVDWSDPLKCVPEEQLPDH